MTWCRISWEASNRQWR